MIKIRQATPDDAGRLAILFDAYRVFYNQEPDAPKATEFLLNRIMQRDSEIFIAESNRMLAAFVQLYPLFSSVRMKKLWLLNDLFVLPEFRGQHLSVQLIARAKQLVRETNSAGLMLETAKNNLIGNNLYQCTGFVKDNDHCYYTWDSGTDAEES